MRYRQVTQQGRLNQRGHRLGTPPDPSRTTAAHHIDASGQPGRAQCAQQPTGKKATAHRQPACKNVRLQACKRAGKHAAYDRCLALIHPGLHLKLTGHPGQDFASRVPLQTVQQDQLSRAVADLGVKQLGQQALRLRWGVIVIGLPGQPWAQC